MENHRMDYAYYTDDTISALDARAEAQRIVFGPYLFQAASALVELGLLSRIADSLEVGITLDELASQSGVSRYGCAVLCEMGLATGMLKLVPKAEQRRFTLGKTGYFFLEDDLTKANLAFMRDICWPGADQLATSIKSGRPEGLKAFGERWRTIYEALSHLPKQAQDSWFGFDHYYSDHIMPAALPIVFDRKVSALFDIGGNTARWALTCVRHDPDVHVTIVDLPGQVAMARKNVEQAGYASRIGYEACDVLDAATEFPKGADVVWMSQFLDCFSPEEITAIIRKVRAAAGPKARVFVLEPLLDEQQYRAATFTLQAISLYFTTMANGNSRMYNKGELVSAIEAGGLKLAEDHRDLGVFSYSLLEFHP